MARPLLATIAAIALAAPFSVSSAMATTITIDNFTEAQTVIAAQQGNPASSSITGAESNLIGGVRFMQVQTTNTQPPPDATQVGTIFNAEGGNLGFANDPTSIGTGWLVYDGTEDRGGLASPATVAGLSFGASVNPSGLNADLLLGQPTGFFTFTADNFDQLQPNALTFSAFAWDMLGNTVGYYEEIDPLNFSPILSYDAFRSDWNDPNSGLGGFDWGQVGALAFRVDSTEQAFDGQITGITATPIPLPASALLLLGGLGGLAGWSFSAKRRRNKS
jgi:hypothetical protein